MAEKERDGAYHDWLFSGFPSYFSPRFSGSLTDITKSFNSADINFLIFAPFPVPQIKQQAPSPVWGGGLFAFWKPYFCR